MLDLIQDKSKNFSFLLLPITIILKTERIISNNSDNFCLYILWSQPIAIASSINIHVTYRSLPFTLLYVCFIGGCN